jgi:hypothetical protein
MNNKSKTRRFLRFFGVIPIKIIKVPLLTIKPQARLPPRKDERQHKAGVRQ